MTTNNELNKVFHSRKKFPALKNNMVLMDNAGGSAVLGSVAEAVKEYLITENVQLGASYDHSQIAERKVRAGVCAMQDWIHAKHIEEVVISPSSTMALRLLSLCIKEQWKKGDEVIITNSDHEANRAPWLDLQQQGIVVKEWKLNEESLQLELNDLEPLISSHTRLLAIPHVSNILGTINPVKDITKFAHDKGVLVCVDGVAFAPHRRIDVQDWDVDFYVFSTYKTFGPHLAVFYGKLHLLDEMKGINHGFIQSVPYKFQPGNVNYELTSSLVELPQYIKSLGEHNDLADGFQSIADHEEKLLQRLFQYLGTVDGVRIIGERATDKSKRVATVSFIHRDFNSDDIVRKVDAFGIGIRYGDFYAVKLIDDLGLRAKNGVVRVSLAHYNSHEEVSQLINAFRTIF